MKRTETGLRSFPKNYWTAITMEFFERGAYYSMMTILGVYLVLSRGEGGLGFSREAAGAVLGVIPPLLYFLPIFSGAFADRWGYRRMLFLAFAFLGVGYFLSGCMTSYPLIFASLIVMAVGAGLFKPIITGTIAHTTTPKNATLGFGIFYWSVNLGSFLFPLFLVPVLKTQGYSYIFWMCAGVALVLMCINGFFFREPQGRSRTAKSVGQILGEMVLVLRDWKFLLMVVIYSGFWIMYFQMYGTVLWYVNEYLDMTAVDRAVNSVLSLFTAQPTSWHFDVEHVTVVNAGVIIVLQLFVSRLVDRMKALPTISIGIALGTLGMVIMALYGQAWGFVLGCVVFTLGEMTAHPKFNAFVGGIAPVEHKALYMGYSFFCSVIGSFVGGFIGAPLYRHFVEVQGRPSAMFLLFAAIGFTSMVGLLLYNRFILRRKQ